jgi:S1-C subfamily serine protease
VSEAGSNGRGRSPALEAAFGRPAGVEGSFAPGGPPTPLPPPPPAPPAPALRRSFGRPQGVQQSFDPPPGALRDTTPPPESPWWKPDADRDPWRDARSPSSLGGPPDLGDGRPAAAADVIGSDSPAGRRRWRLRDITLTAALVLLLAGVLTGVAGGVVGYLAASRITPALLDPDAELAEVSTPVTRPPGSIADIAQRVLPVVVSIEVRSSAGSGTGSGVVIDGAGYVLTNNHVISQVATGSGQLRVRFNDGAVEDARVVGRDPKTDLAVLKVDKPGLTVAALGDSSKIAVGDPVIAIGSPLGLRGTVTSGIVSALDRPVRLGGEGSGSGSDTNAVINAIQTDAPINPGNSGGALVDGSGAVVGINSAIATLSTGAGQSGSIGLGFAIPINEARGIAQQLIRTGKVKHATLGVTASSVTDGARDGALVQSVAAGSAAAEAGIAKGDVITKVGDKLVGGADDLVVQVRTRAVGEKVELTYVDEQTKRTTKTTVTLKSD